MMCMHALAKLPPKKIAYLGPQAATYYLSQNGHSAIPFSGVTAENAHQIDGVSALSSFFSVYV